jgi:hypothetical protein
MKSDKAKDYSMADRAVILLCRVAQGGLIHPQDWAWEFSISKRQAQRDLAVVNRHYPICAERLDDSRTVYRRKESLRGDGPRFGRRA